MRVKTVNTLFQAALPLASCLTVLTALSVVLPANAQVSGSHSGIVGGIDWSIYTKSNSTGTVSITPGTNPGNYGATWKTFRGNFVLGTGWSGNQSTAPSTPTPANSIISVGYNVGSYSEGQEGSVSVYGFFNSDASHPTVEFYIVERWNPAVGPPGTNGTLKASNVVIGEGTYNIYLTMNGPQRQYFSVRTTQSTAGQNHKVLLNQHIAKWNSLGLTTSGDRRGVTLATESEYQPGTSTDTGNVNATVWDAGS